MDQESIVLDIDPRSVLAAIKQANTAVEGWEKGTVGAGERMQKSLERMAEMLLKTNDRSHSSMERLTQSIERQAVVYNKTGVEKLIADRDRFIKKLGDEQGMIDRVTASYAKMIEAENGKSGGSLQAMGRNIEGFLREPLNASKEAATGLLEKLGPMGEAVAGGAAVLAAFAVAGFEAAKSLGEWGTHIKDVELRTGLSAKEVGNFSFAARAVGQDVSIFERMMKGLSQAVDDNSTEGEKARATLQKLGVALHDTSGAIKPTAQILEDISEGLARMPNALERDAAAIALFKRAGIEAIPVITELSENLRFGEGHVHQISQDEVERAEAYARVLAELGSNWENLKRSFQQPLAASVNFLFNGLSWAEFMVSAPGKLVMGALFSGKPTATDLEMGETQGWGYGGSMSRSRHAAEQRSIATNDALVAAARVSDPGNKQLELAEKKLSELQGQLKTGVVPSVNEALLKQIAQQRELIDGIKAHTEEAKKLKEFLANSATFQRKGDEAGLSEVGKIYYELDQLLKTGTGLRGGDKAAAADRAAAAARVAVVMKQEREKFEEADRVRVEKASEHTTALYLPTKDQLKDWHEGFATEEKDRKTLAKDLLGYQEAMLRLQSGPGGELETAQKIFLLRVQAADTLVEKQGIALDYLRQEAQIQADIAQKQQEALDRQTASIAAPASGLFHTLFTNPASFGKDLVGTLHEAVLKPVTEGLGGMVASALHPLIYGADGAGGIAGIFKGVFGGGKQDPMKASTDLNTAVTAQNSAVMATLTAVLAGVMGMAPPAIAAPTGIGGISLPSISAPAMSGGGPSMSFGPAGFGQGSGSSGMETGPDIYNLPTQTRTMNPLTGVLGISGGDAAPGIVGGGSLFGNLRGVWGGMKSSVGLGHISTDANGDRWTTVGNQSIPLDSVGGYANAIGRSPAFGAAGMVLAQQGLLGSSRGTWTGVAEGTAGGAMIGFQLGGPLGAAIGAAAGFGIGLGEKLAGVESQRNEAIRLVRQIYALNINNGTADQIVALAKQKYGNAVSVAVRSPDVRQLLQLYAESTGQKSNLFLNDPHGANLVQANGLLQQSAVYNNGTAYTYASSLSTFGTAGATIPTGNPFAGPVTVMVSPEATTNLWTTGVAQGIAGSPRQVASANVNGGTSSSARINGATMMLSPGVVAF